MTQLTNESSPLAGHLRYHRSVTSLGPLNGANDSTTFGVRSPSFSANNVRAASKGTSSHTTNEAWS